MAKLTIPAQELMHPGPLGLPGLRARARDASAPEGARSPVPSSRSQPAAGP